MLFIIVMTAAIVVCMGLLSHWDDTPRPEWEYHW